jgi:PBP1b-binding outer membrane lipoprotein LpoB
MNSMKQRYAIILLVSLFVSGCASLTKSKDPKHIRDVNYAKAVGRRGEGIKLSPIDQERMRFVQSNETDIQMNSYYVSTRQLHTHILKDEARVNDITIKIITDIAQQTNQERKQAQKKPK